jgi:hypothetical protein
MTCRGCGRDLGAIARVGRRDTCPGCGVELHACRQCRFYDARAYNECHEPQAERVLDKTRGNFCEYFAIPDAAPPAGPVPVRSGPSVAATASRAGGARADLERLFRKR